MQNWNQWQVPAGTATTPMPPTPAGLTAPGADPMVMMQSYMQYYNQPAPSGYTAEQWAAAQQQNWTQWQQWQQQFQQWQAQYGEKYQETIKQFSAQGLTLPNVTQAPPLPRSQPAPPLPKEENAKPPLPPDSNNPYQYSNIPPPHQNNLPLFPSKSQSNDYSSNVTTYSQAPPLPPGQPPPPTSNPQEPPSVNMLGEKRGNNEPVNFGSAKKNKIEDEELSEAEKTFDAQFKQWEEQYNKWEQQNANHPDKTQYKQYEAQWASWRKKLMDRREQMRKKREQRKQTAKIQSEKTESIPGGNNILNILSSSENQGLINNLLGIGKTLGLTGKQAAEKPSTSTSNAISAASMPQIQQSQTAQPTAMAPPTMTTDMTQAAWAAQQWAAQYNASIGLPNYGGFQLVPGIMPPPITGQPIACPPMTGQPMACPPMAGQPMAGQPIACPPMTGSTMAGLPMAAPQGPGNNFSQPPPNLPNSTMNFSQPPPGFATGDSRQISGSGIRQNQHNMQDRLPPLFGTDGDKRDNLGGNEQFPQSRDNPQSVNNRSDNSDRFGFQDRGSSLNQFAPMNNRFGRDTQKNEFGGSNRGGGDNERFSQPTDRFGSNRQANDFESHDRSAPGQQFRLESDSFAPRNDCFRPDNDRFGTSNERDSANNRLNRENDSFAPTGDRFGISDRTGLGINRMGRDPSNFGPSNDRFGISNDRLGSDIERFPLNNDRFGSSLANDQFAPGYKDRFGLGKDRYGSGNNLLGSSNDRLGSNDRFESGNSRFASSTDKDNFNINHSFNNDNFGPENERYSRQDRGDMPDLFDSKDLNYMKDNRRDNFGDNIRGLNRNVRPFQASNTIAPELKILMEKRRTAMDVFKPRDDVFNPVKRDNIGSLSESFKKITGDRPYASRSPVDTGPKGLFGPGPRGSENVMARGPGDFGSRGGGSLHGNNTFGPQSLRGMELGNFGGPVPDRFRSREEFGGPRNEFAPSRAPDNFGLRSRGDFEFRTMDNRTMLQPPDNLASTSKDGFSNLDQQGFDNRDIDRPKIDQTQPFGLLSASKHGENALHRDERPEPVPNSSTNALSLERPPWIDAQFPEQKSGVIAGVVKTDSPVPDANLMDKSDNSVKENNATAEKPDVLIVEKSGSDNKDPENANNIANQQANQNEQPAPSVVKTNCDGKDKNALPFMGENDPKPEDLNMEPPPALPNLGPITETPDMPAFRANVPTAKPNNDTFSPNKAPPIPQQEQNPPFFGTPGAGTGPFRPGGPNINQFGPRGPGMNRFEPRNPNDGQFAPRGPNHSPFGIRGQQFSQRGPHDGQFGPRGSNENHFGPRGLSNSAFGQRGPGQIGPKGIHDNQFNIHSQRDPNDSLLGVRPIGEQFSPMGHGFLRPRGPLGGQFGQRPQNQSGFPFPRGTNEGQFRPTGPNEGNYAAPAPNDGQKQAIPSLLGLQFDKQPKFESSIKPGNIINEVNTDLTPSGGNMDEMKMIDGRQSMGGSESDPKPPFALDQRPQFGPHSQFSQGRPPGPEHQMFGRDSPGDMEQRSFPQGGPLPNDQRPHMWQGRQTTNSPQSQGFSEERPSLMQSSPRGSDKTSSMVQGALSNLEQKMEPNALEQRPLFGQGRQGDLEENVRCGQNHRPNFDSNLRGNNDEVGFSETRQGMMGPSHGPCEKNLHFESGFYDRNSDLVDRHRSQQPVAVEEFRVGQQFNYNHRGSAVDNVISEIIPEKVIDYGHATKVTVHEYITPAQSFDYGHGNLKPEVPEHEVISRRDFLHWEDTEQSLKEYDERLRLAEQENNWQHQGKLRDDFKFERSNPRELDWSRVERRPVTLDDRKILDREVRARRERDNREERKEHDRERDKECGREDRERDFDREDRTRRDGSDNRDRNRDRHDRMKMDQNKENNKDDERCKANISRQEYQNKSTANTSQQSSTSEPKDESSETISKTMELPRIPNYTMVDDILFQPGRQTRPPKIVIILRGPPGSGKSFVAKLIKDKEVEQGGSAPRILSLDDYFLTEKERETKDDNGKKVVIKDMVYEYEEAMEQSYLTSLIKAFKKNITDGYFNFIILDCINEKISDYEDMWSFAKTKGFQVYVCEMEMDVHICMKRNVHNRTEDEINKIVDYFEPTPSHHLKLDVNSMLQEEAIDEVQMEDSQQLPEETGTQGNEDSQDSQEDKVGVSKWEKMDADNKLDRLDGLAKKKNESRPQTMEDFLQVPDYYNMEDDSGKKRVRWADLEERKEQEKLRAVGFVVGHTNWDRMMDPTKGQSALTRTKYI